MRSVGTRTVAVLLTVATALVGVGVALGLYFESPEQAALRTPPTAIQITDQLRSEVLEDWISFRGVFVPASRGPLRFSSSLEGRVVTAVGLQPGSDLSYGTSVIEVEGRPIIVLPGALPAWRDFLPGMTAGPDVAQLQRALTGLGLYDGQPDGEFNSRTLAASKSLYRSLGYRPPLHQRVPQEEIVFAPAALHRVSSVALRAGDRLTAVGVELSSSDYRIDADLSVDGRSALLPGTRIELIADGGSAWTSTISAVIDLGASDTPGRAGTGIRVVDSVPSGLAGERAFRVVLFSTTRPVLSAAAAAVHVSGNGDLYVVRVEAGSQRSISVTVGLVTASRIEIRAVAPATLAPDDLLLLNPSS